MAEYKNTLNLPHTSFPMKANLVNKELEILKFWGQEDIYGRMQELRKQSTDKFILNYGPPYANGDIHLGHALNNILKDIIIKMKNLSGLHAPFVPGWDCHGLPIEIKIEKALADKKKTVDNKEFRHLARVYAEQQINIQRENLKRLGVLADWENPYLTMDKKYIASTLRTLAKIIANGHLTSGFKPVHWCTACRSSLAEAEVEYKDKNSFAIEVAFKVADNNDLNSRLNINVASDIMVVIWTTTPWTLPANEAVCLHPEFTYVIAYKDNKYYILAQELLPQFSMQDLDIVVEFQGIALENLKLQHPFYDKLVPVILSEHVTLDMGTGCVHSAPAHGMEDYIVGMKYHLPINTPVETNGCFQAETMPKVLANLHVLKANEVVIDVLREQQRLINAKEITHSYPHCWRHKTPLIFLATRQWFISMEKKNLREQALAAIKGVKWVPTWGEQRIHNMLAVRPDWCISRQRIWGMPLPLFVHKTTHTLHKHTIEIINKVAEMIEVNGIEYWHQSSDHDFIGTDKQDYYRLTDTLDVWFESGCVHEALAAKYANLFIPPVDLYIEGSDQYRGWFHSSLLVALASRGNAPYKEVITHGFTLDVSGQKMSKSLGNVINPVNVVRTLGADILRLWVASLDYTRDVHVSEEILQRMSDGYRRIRNTVRFLLANLGDFSVEHIIEVKNLVLIDRWLITHVKKLQQQVLESYKNYQFHTVVQIINNFCINDLGGFYLDIIKDRQYTGAKNGVLRRSAQTAMYYTLQAFLRWLAPILSFTAEEIWQHMDYKIPEKEKSIFLTNWWVDFPVLADDLADNQEFWENLQKIRGYVNKELELLRQQNIIGSSLDAEVILYADGIILADLQKIEPELKFLFITSMATVEPFANASKNAVSSDDLELKMLVQPSKYNKCERCWHKTKSVGEDHTHPTICKRCIINISSEEKRMYV